MYMYACDMHIAIACKNPPPADRFLFSLPSKLSWRGACSARDGGDNLTMADIEIDEETNRQLDKWVTAKRNRDYASADGIRAALEAKGIRAEQVRPHVYEPPGQGRPREDRRLGGSSWTALATTTDDRPSPADRQEKKTIQGFKQTFGYVPPANEQPWAASLTSNSGKIVQQEGSIVPVTGKAVDGAFRPPGMRVTGEKRTGEGGGFREFDDAEATRRKRRALEVKAETSARKAEKKKCDYWCALLATALRPDPARQNPSRLPRQQAGVVHLLKHLAAAEAGAAAMTSRDALERRDALARQGRGRGTRDQPEEWRGGPWRGMAARVAAPKDPAPPSAPAAG